MWRRDENFSILRPAWSCIHSFLQPSPLPYHLRFMFRVEKTTSERRWVEIVLRRTHPSCSHWSHPEGVRGIRNRTAAHFCTTVVQLARWRIITFSLQRPLWRPMFSVDSVTHCHISWNTYPSRGLSSLYPHIDIISHLWATRLRLLVEEYAVSILVWSSCNRRAPKFMFGVARSPCEQQLVSAWLIAWILNREYPA